MSDDKGLERAREPSPSTCRGAEPAAPANAWRHIDSAPLGGPFLAIDAKWELRRCWRHQPSSRTDEILTWARNGRFKATHWMPLPEPPEGV